MEYIYRGVVAEKLNARLTGALVLGCPYGVLIGLEDCEPAVRLELLAVNHANKKRIAQTLHKPYKAFHPKWRWKSLKACQLQPVTEDTTKGLKPSKLASRH